MTQEWNITLIEKYLSHSFLYSFQFWTVFIITRIKVSYITVTVKIFKNINLPNTSINKGTLSKNSKKNTKTWSNKSLCLYCFWADKHYIECVQNLMLRYLAAKLYLTSVWDQSVNTNTKFDKVVSVLCFFYVIMGNFNRILFLVVWFQRKPLASYYRIPCSIPYFI